MNTQNLSLTEQKLEQWLEEREAILCAFNKHQNHTHPVAEDEE